MLLFLNGRTVSDRNGCGGPRNRIASVIRFAAYFGFPGVPNPKHEEITVRGTERLLRHHQGLVDSKGRAAVCQRQGKN